MSVDDPEVKKEGQTHHTVGRENLDPLDVMINRYSSWYRIKKGVAWLLRFKEYLIKKHRPATCSEPGNASCSSSRELTMEDVSGREDINHVRAATNIC